MDEPPVRPVEGDALLTVQLSATRDAFSIARSALALTQSALSLSQFSATEAAASTASLRSELAAAHAATAAATEVGHEWQRDAGAAHLAASDADANSARLGTELAAAHAANAAATHLTHEAVRRGDAAQRDATLARREWDIAFSTASAVVADAIHAQRSLEHQLYASRGEHDALRQLHTHLLAEYEILAARSQQGHDAAPASRHCGAGRGALGQQVATACDTAALPLGEPRPPPAVGGGERRASSASSLHGMAAMAAHGADARMQTGWAEYTPSTTATSTTEGSEHSSGAMP